MKATSGDNEIKPAAKKTCGVPSFANPPVADITDGNPNVAYEIGLADVLGKQVVLLCQGDKVPFDFLGQRLICYAPVLIAESRSVLLTTLGVYVVRKLRTLLAKVL